MARHETLRRVELEIQAGELGKARDRLEGLLLTYPDDLEVRKRLGDVFWRLQYPEKAGRYWYLLPSESSDMDAAKRAFERRYNDSPSLMLYELRYRGGLDSIAGTYAGEALLRLATRARMSRSSLESLVARRQFSRPRENLRGSASEAGCGAIVIIVLLLVAIGLINGIITVLGWIS